ncbi:hypothetical protein [Mangrovivirga cuniculi]|uniref:hypothetical protein n=1 Tax=Mangrovivirga cuniculi TaxID=2715131 RepID=UPI001586D282|nr:hypothetical protein [Mangrovivirga cuniculi]
MTVEYHSGVARADYTVYVQGLSDGKSLSYDGYFLAEDDGLTTQIIKINKSGDNYAVID